MNQTSPQAIFQKYAQKGHRLHKEFSMQESQEMASQFFNSWNTIMTRAMESPEEWFETLSGLYKQQFSLWLSMFAPSRKNHVEAETGDRRFSASEWDQSPLHSYLKQSYLLSSRWLTGLIERRIVDQAREPA